MPPTAWQLVGRTATLRTPSLIAIVDPERPSAGVKIESVSGEPISGATLFGVQIEPAATTGQSEPAALPFECFVRGNDLIATYAEAADRPFRAQIYWRLINDENRSDEHRRDICEPIATLELIVSVQTSRLDIETTVGVCSTLGHVESWQMLGSAEDRSSDSAAAGSDCCLIRPIGMVPSYAEMVHPADFRQTTFELSSASPPVARLTHRLFAERLEKGVILRSRIRGSFVPRGQAAEIARAEYRRFAASEPPLTA